MAKFPTYEEMGKKVAEEALDGYIYKSKTLREWVDILSSSEEPCTDAISRDMALEKMTDYVASGYADSAEDFEEYSKIICQLPPVTPAEKVGQWINHKCSFCGYGVMPWNDTPYCPNCGAKMASLTGAESEGEHEAGD